VWGAHIGFQPSADDMHKLHMKGASGSAAATAAAAMDTASSLMLLQSIDLCNSSYPFLLSPLSPRTDI